MIRPLPAVESGRPSVRSASAGVSFAESLGRIDSSVRSAWGPAALPRSSRHEETRTDAKRTATDEEIRMYAPGKGDRRARMMNSPGTCGAQLDDARVERR